MEKDLAKNKGFKKLCKALAGLKNEKDISLLLRDIATFSELMGMSERLQVAQLLQEGMPYRAIAKKTGASTTTVTRVAHWIHHGMGGYKLVLE